MAIRINQDAELVVGDFLQINVTLDDSFTGDLTTDLFNIFYAVKASEFSQTAVITKESLLGVGAEITITSAKVFAILIDKDDTEGVALFDALTAPTNYFHSAKIVDTVPTTDRPYTVFTGQLKVSPQEVEENPPA